MIPSDVPVIHGWTPLDSEDQCGPGDVMYVRKTAQVYDKVFDKYKVEYLVRHYSLTWVYRRAKGFRTFDLVPSGLAIDPGWFPIPDDEIIESADRYFYKDGRPPSRPNDSRGESPKSWGLTIHSGGYPCRYGVDFGYGGGKPKRIKIDNPKLSEPLPLP